MWIQSFKLLYTGSFPGFCVLRTWCGKDCKLTTSKLNVHLSLLSNRILNSFGRAMYTTRDISFLSLSYQLDVAKWPDVDQWGVSGRAELYFREVLNRERVRSSDPLFFFPTWKANLMTGAPAAILNFLSDLEKEAKMTEGACVRYHRTTPARNATARLLLCKK